MKTVTKFDTPENRWIQLPAQPTIFIDLTLSAFLFKKQLFYHSEIMR